MEITEINKLQKVDFVKIFGNVVECYPQVSEKLYECLPFKCVEEIVERSEEILNKLNFDEKETILKLHPDLAGKLSDENKLTAESTEEQRAAGLHNITRETKNELNHLNKLYKEKFGFPFVACARENKVDAILKGLRLRLKNENRQELVTGINEVKKICKLRIKDIIKN